jgi:predicted  nucleic acid-binding Zn-ribbon protein
MSLPQPYPQLYNNEVPQIFNPADFYTTEFIPSLQTNQSIMANIQASSVSSNQIQLVSSDTGNSIDVATQEDLTNLQNTLLGSSNLQSSLDTIRAISDAINDDPNFYTDLTTSIQNVQTQVNTVNSTLSTVQSKQTVDESNISTLQSQISTANSNISTLQANTSAISYNSSTGVTTITSKLTAKAGSNGSVTLGDTSGDSLTVNCGTTSFVNNSISTNAVNGLTSKLSGYDTTLSNLATELATDESNIASNTSAISTINGRLTTDEANIASNTSSISTINGRLTTDEANISSNTSAISTINGKLTTDEANIASNASAISTINGRLTTDESNISTLQSQMTSANSSISTLNSKTSAISYNSSTATTTITSKLSATAGTNGSVTLGDSSGDTLTVNCGTTSFVNGSIASSAINNSSFVDLSSTQTVSGTKTINSLKSTTQSQHDNSTNVSTTAYVDNAISALVGTAPSTLQTLQQIDAYLGNNGNVSSTLAQQIGACGQLSGSNTWSGQNTFSSTVLLSDGSNLVNRLGTDESNISTLQSQMSTANTNITNLQGATSGLSYSSGTTSLSNNLSCKSITDNGTFTATGNVSLGTNTSNSITLNGNVLANSQTITPTQLGYLSTLSSNVQTQLNGKQATLSYDTVPTSSSTNMVNSGNIYNALQNYATTSSLTSGLAGKQNSLTFDTTPTSSSSNPITSGGVYTALTSKQNTLTYDTSPVSGHTSNVLSSDAIYNTLQNYQPTSGMSSYLTTSSASSTYLTQSNASSTYQTQSGMSSYAPINNASFTGVTNVNEVSEIIYVGGAGSSLSLSYTSIRGIVYFAPSGNFTLTLTNVPTTSTVMSYTLTFIYTTKYYCNAISVNGSSYTMIASGGLSNISVNSSATNVMQTISICFLNSSTPTVITNVVSLF